MARHTWVRSIYVAVYLAANVGIYVCFGWIGILNESITFATFVILFLAINFLANVLYIAVGYAIGIRLCRFGFGPFVVVLEQGGMKLRRKPMRSGSGVWMFPINERHLTRQLSVMSITLPTIHLGFVIVAEAIQIQIWLAGGDLSFICQAIAMGFFVLVWSAVRKVPATRTPNSRGRLAMLRRGGPGADRYGAWMPIAGSSYSGMRPREWHPQWIEHITALHDESLEELGCMLDLYYWALDRGDSEQEGQALVRALTLYPVHQPAYRDKLFLEAAFYQAWVHQDAVTAREYVAKMKWKHASKRERLRTEAAILLAERRREEAWMRASQALAIHERATEAGFARAEDAWISALMARAAGIVPQTQTAVASA